MSRALINWSPNSTLRAQSRKVKSVHACPSITVPSPSPSRPTPSQPYTLRTRFYKPGFSPHPSSHQPLAPKNTKKQKFAPYTFLHFFIRPPVVRHGRRTPRPERSDQRQLSVGSVNFCSKSCFFHRGPPERRCPGNVRNNCCTTKQPNFCLTVVNSLPIVARELRVVSRRPGLYWIRVAFAAVGMAAAVLMFFEGSRRIGPGDEMLWLLSVVTLLLALLTGCLFTADCISSEKREDTLGLLFLTNLKGHDIVAGKISTHAITTASGLLAALPVFFLPLLAGGVTWAETIRVLIAIGVSFVFALSLGVWISARSRDARNAVMATLTVMSLIMVAPLLSLLVIEELFPGRPSPLGFPQLSPGMLLYFARDDWYARPNARQAYWISLGIFAVASMIFTALASGLLPKVWQSSGTQSAAANKQRPWRDAKWQDGLAAWRRVNRFSIANPLQDLLLRRRTVSRWPKYLQRAVAAFFIVMLLGSFGNDDCYPFAVMALYAMHASAKFVFAFDATRALNEDKRSSALELLLATPLSDREIVEGQERAFKVQFRRPLRRLFWFTVGAQFVAIFSSELRLDGEDLFLMGSFLWGPMIWTWSDYRVVTSLGMRHALRRDRWRNFSPRRIR